MFFKTGTLSLSFSSACDFSSSGAVKYFVTCSENKTTILLTISRVPKLMSSSDSNFTNHGIAGVLHNLPLLVEFSRMK